MLSFSTSGGPSIILGNGREYEIEGRSRSSKLWKVPLKMAYMGKQTDQFCQNDPTGADVVGKAIGRSRHIDEILSAAQSVERTLTQHLHSAVGKWTTDYSYWRFSFQDLEVEILAGGLTGIDVVARSATMPRRHLDPLRYALRGILRDFIGHDTWSAMGFAVMLLQIVEEAAGRLGMYQDSVRACGRSWDARTAKGIEELIGNDFGVDLLTVNDTAQHLLGQSVSNVCNQVAALFRIVHVEPVFRNEHVAQFLKCKADIREDLLRLSHAELRKCVSEAQIRKGEIEDSTTGLVDYLSQPQVTFHGSHSRLLESIVRYGFLVPGGMLGKTGHKVQVQHGTSFGVGIYSSPDHLYALWYSNYSTGTRSPCHAQDIAGFRLVICAVLRGRPLEISHDQSTNSETSRISTRHSLVSPNQKEYIVFKSAQIIPCYVLTLDLGADSAKQILDNMTSTSKIWERSNKISRVPDLDLEATNTSPGALVAKKKALQAAAAKWFPHGYGPVTGSKLVIEAIGDISDDEEDYGEFQRLRHNSEESTYEGERAEDEQTSWFDQFQTVRATKRDVYLSS